MDSLNPGFLERKYRFSMYTLYNDYSKGKEFDIPNCDVSDIQGSDNVLFKWQLINIHRNWKEKSFAHQNHKLKDKQF